ncbi:MAG: Mth938-like domain-containing protein [Hydrogenovibrio sp.]|nr:Mth938-like domain-containing protein [Hydrogenovibrio sp.]
MKFTEHRDSNILTVKKYQPGFAKINDMSVTESFYMNQKQLIENWGCRDIDELTEHHLDQVLMVQPEIIILGTGEKQSFPPAKLFSYCAQKGVGLEVMDNAAACRTYNVLTTEEREVALALIL